MSEVRNNDGCWTCRARRKKCDEKSPICQTCAALELPCHGYGLKPKWMDRGAQEKEVTDQLRLAVKQTLSRQRLSRKTGTPSLNVIGFDESPSLHHDTIHDVSYINVDQPSGEAPEDFFDSIDISATPYTWIETQGGAFDLSERDSVTFDSVSTSAFGTNNSLSRAHTLESVEAINFCPDICPYGFQGDQANLLMHFFDHVMPFQFRFYHPSVADGGRGWLLSVLSQSKALYGVALSLAAYHQQATSVENGPKSAKSKEILQTRHLDCIHVLQCYMAQFTNEKPHTSQDFIESVACITLLVVLELFRGDVSDWQLHLQAAASLSMRYGKDCLRRFVPLMTPTQKVATEFFLGVITWYEILSCASTGMEPFSDISHVPEDMFPVIRFDKLMGCENWAVRVIWQIASLAEWKTRMEASGGVSNWELLRRGAEIKESLQAGNKTFELTERTTSLDTSQSTIREVTRIFASAALVYLEVTISGPHPNIPEIRQAVSNTMLTLTELPDKTLVRNLLWPICIAGCMSASEHEPYWRNLLSGVNPNDDLLGYSVKVLRIMEKCWVMRRSQSKTVVTVDWLTAMRELDMKVLLV